MKITSKLLLISVIMFGFQTISLCQKFQVYDHCSNLFGRVKSISTESYRIVQKDSLYFTGDIFFHFFDGMNIYNENGLLVERKYRKNDGEVYVTVILNTYDLNDKLIKCSQYNEQLFLWNFPFELKNTFFENYRYENTGDFIYKCQVSYDDINRVERLEYFNHRGELSLLCKYEYSDKQEICKYYQNNTFFKEDVYKFNNELVIEIKTYEISSQRTLRTVNYNYDSVDNLIEIQTNLVTEKGKRFETEKYDVNGNIVFIKSINYDSEGDISWRGNSSYIFQYDSFNNIISEDNYQSSDTNDILNTKISYSYVFDNQNNWTRRIMNKDSKPSVVTYREIVYY